MTPDLGFVSDAPQTDTHELAAESSGNTAAERGLADAGCPDQAEDGSLQFTDQRQHSDMVEDTILYLVESVVGLIESSRCMFD
jgi:hypothetical protein